MILCDHLIIKKSLSKLKGGVLMTNYNQLLISFIGYKLKKKDGGGSQLLVLIDCLNLRQTRNQQKLKCFV